MSESVESYLARGGKVVAVPIASGKKEIKQPRGHYLRARLDAEAETGKARKTGARP